MILNLEISTCECQGLNRQTRNLYRRGLVAANLSTSPLSSLRKHKHYRESLLIPNTTPAPFRIHQRLIWSLLFTLIPQTTSASESITSKPLNQPHQHTLIKSNPPLLNKTVHHPNSPSSKNAAPRRGNHKMPQRPDNRRSHGRRLHRPLVNLVLPRTHATPLTVTFHEIHKGIHRSSAGARH